ncbi:polysaccharide deacetylase family protein [Sphingobium sp. MK2]|uniref:polysaccharide deacetylase family protein n=1 Tax=Sphingobium sp. MK2 TaxID=3116540 RepID=UPI0032E3645D
MKITLTFDNGPHPTVTYDVLSILAARRIQAIFFVLGKNIANPLLREIAIACKDAGHRIGNHSYTHDAPLGHMEDDVAIDEIAGTDRLLGELVGDERLFRPVGRKGRIGSHMFRPRTWDFLCAKRYTCVLWNCLAEEWIDPNDWLQRTVERCRAQEWSVVVLHDLATGAIDHLAEFLDILIADGAQFTLDLPQDCLASRRGIATPLANQIVATKNEFARQDPTGG